MTAPIDRDELKALLIEHGKIQSEVNPLITIGRQNAIEDLWHALGFNEDEDVPSENGKEETE